MAGSADSESALDGNSRGGEVVAIGIVVTVMAGVLVSSRLFTRLVILRCPGLDDLLVTCSLATSIALTILTVKQVQYGLGRHFESLTDEMCTQNLKALWSAIIVYYTSLGLVKTSIIIQYLRIFVDRGTRTTCWILLVVVTSYSLTTIFCAAFTCYPVHLFWDMADRGPKSCLDQKALWFSNASLNIVSDIAVLICPMPALKSLQLPRRQKIGVMIIFAVGFATVVMSILRLYSLYVISVSIDVSWDNVGAATWSMVELNTGITCACLPLLKPLITRLFPRLLGGASRHAGSNDFNSMGAYSRQTNRNPLAATAPLSLSSSSRKHHHTNNSFCMVDTGTCSRIRGGVDADGDVDVKRDDYGSEIQITTVVEVSRRRDEGYCERAREGGGGGSANTSERNLVLPLQKI